MQKSGTNSSKGRGGDTGRQQGGVLKRPKIGSSPSPRDSGFGNEEQMRCSFIRI